uniref:Uncharacterized protein n=1 Tax=Anguilla anguilla TaxID=7936 RepID=A0A0E9V7P8_ANGAN
MLQTNVTGLTRYTQPTRMHSRRYSHDNEVLTFFF